ncbi:MAG: helix-turn-helix transcriptional regulator [Clostridia bacterium]|nr:helix-turn-helix transcriptional regulator [Clostridia bacterium]
MTTKPENFNSVTDMKGLRRSSLPYLFIWIIYYAWVIVFTTWWTASPLPDNVFGTGLRSMLHSVNLISSAIFIFVIKKEWFVKAARVGAATLVTGMVIYLIFGGMHIGLIAAIVIGVFLGCVNISILIPFVFTLNNTEKFYAVVGSYLLIGGISVLRESRADSFVPNAVNMLLSLAILVIALCAVPFFRKEDVLDTAAAQCANIPPRAYLTLLINCIFAILCKGAGTGILDVAAGNSALHLSVWNAAGGLTGGIFYIAIYRFSKKGIHLAWNITFGCLAMGLFCNAFASQSKGLVVLFALLLGIGNTIGMINMYYILGVIGKKYNSMRYLQLSILFIGICGGISGVAAGNAISQIHTFDISIAASVISAAVMVLFLILSPVLAQTYYGDEWVSDSDKSEVDNEHLYLFKKYSLSKRETEVCKLLLQGYTMRQISAMLSIAYPTVNTYCTSVYRKLNINSRTELLILFKDYSLK